ncbi:MAG: sodium:proton antiporter [Alphaproteobacteria bacterium]|nr:sodium:proton antiporter [Alphaproteobacteria bacterium]
MLIPFSYALASRTLGATLLALCLAVPAFAATGTPHLPNTELGLIWVVPFVGILLSIALFPLFAPHFWEKYLGKICTFWAATLLIPMFLQYGIAITTYEVLHTYLLEYIPFIILLFALFTITGGITLKGTLVGTPILNTVILIVGTVIASWMGTTGAAMLTIRPLLRANKSRKNKTHIVVFFIFLVANIGGSLTPLGDPPLFLGFLKGVEFFWTTTNMVVPMMLVTGILIPVFYTIDLMFYKREIAMGNDPFAEIERGIPLELQGRHNLLLLAGVVGAVLLSGSWDSGVNFTIYHVDITLQALARDVLLLLLAGSSLLLTGQDTRKMNEFNWFPIQEVGMLFAGIFVTIIPVIRMLSAGTDGAMANVITLVSNPDGSPNNAMYFWLTGGLSAFLDNAPTYLMFFNTAGGDAKFLMSQGANTLLAISAGSVFMGAMTYIGNAPNFMVRSIAESSGVKMPSFFGYMAWSCCFLLPCFLLVTWVFFF